MFGRSVMRLAVDTTKLVRNAVDICNLPVLNRDHNLTIFNLVEFFKTDEFVLVWVLIFHFKLLQYISIEKLVAEPNSLRVFVFAK